MLTFDSIVNLTFIFQKDPQLRDIVKIFSLFVGQMREQTVTTITYVIVSAIPTEQSLTMLYYSIVNESLLSEQYYTVIAIYNRQRTKRMFQCHSILV